MLSFEMLEKRHGDFIRRGVKFWQRAFLREAEHPSVFYLPVSMSMLPSFLATGAPAAVRGGGGAGRADSFLEGWVLIRTALRKFRSTMPPTARRALELRIDRIVDRESFANSQLPDNLIRLYGSERGCLATLSDDGCAVTLDALQVWKTVEGGGMWLFPALYKNAGREEMMEASASGISLLFGRLMTWHDLKWGGATDDAVLDFLVTALSADAAILSPPVTGAPQEWRVVKWGRTDEEVARAAPLVRPRVAGAVQRVVIPQGEDIQAVKAVLDGLGMPIVPVGRR